MDVRSVRAGGAGLDLRRGPWSRSCPVPAARPAARPTNALTTPRPRAPWVTARKEIPILQGNYERLTEYMDMGATLATGDTYLNPSYLSYYFCAPRNRRSLSANLVFWALSCSDFS